MGMNFFFTRNTNVMSLGHAHDHVTREEKKSINLYDFQLIST